MGVMAALTLRDVVVAIGSRRVLDGISFAVGTRETLAVAGWPGFGGTTLARVIVGALRPSEGAVRVGDDDVTAIPSDRRAIGYVPAGGGLLPHLNVADNISYGLRVRSTAPYQIATLTSSAAERFELVASLNMRPHQLSPGQRLRVALARVSLRRPRPAVVVVDATSGGNADGVADLASRISSDAPPAVIVIANTGNADVVSEARHLVVIDDHKVATRGRVSQLRQDPPDLLTAILVHRGPLPVHAGVAGEDTIDCGRVTLPRPAWLPAGLTVKVALPSDALQVCGADVPATNCVAVAATPEGARVQVLAEPDGLPGVRWPLRFLSSDRPRLGERLRVGVTADRLLVFTDDAAARRRRGTATGGTGPGGQQSGGES